MIEFVAVGTAVRSERYDLGDEPVLSNLSGQDFAKLYASGYWPVGIVADTTVLYVMTGWSQKMGSSTFAPNQELAGLHPGDPARAEARGRPRGAGGARSSGPPGWSGMSLEVSQREYERKDANDNEFKDMIVTVHALGTAIVELERKDEPPPIYIGLPMNEESG